MLLQVVPIDIVHRGNMNYNVQVNRGGREVAITLAHHASKTVVTLICILNTNNLNVHPWLQLANRFFMTY